MRARRANEEKNNEKEEKKLEARNHKTGAGGRARQNLELGTWNLEPGTRAKRALPMQRVGNLQNQGAVGFSRKNTVGKTGLIVNDEEIIDGAEDVVEAYLECRQFTLAVVLEKSRGE